MVARIGAIRRAAVVLATATGAAAAVAVACGPGDLGDLTAGRPDAGGDAGVVDSSIASTPPRPSARPLRTDRTSQASSSRSTPFGSRRTSRTAGRPSRGASTLDMACTCADPKLEPESCIPPDSGDKRVCDGVDGRDNAAGPLMSAASIAGKGVGPAAFQKKIESGVFNVLMTVDGWNGQPDDPAVVVGVLLSNGVEGSQNEAGAPLPKFDGTDVWTVAPSRCSPASTSSATTVGRSRRTASRSGSIRRRTCVTTRSSRISTSRCRSTPRQARSRSSSWARRPRRRSSKTETDTASPARSSAAGRSSASFRRLLGSRTRSTPSIRSARRTRGSRLYSLVKKTACAAVDLAANPAADRTSARCDALSNAISFTAVTATAGTIFSPWARRVSVPTSPTAARSDAALGRVRRTRHSLPKVG